MLAKISNALLTIRALSCVLVLVLSLSPQAVFASPASCVTIHAKKLQQDPSLGIAPDEVTLKLSKIITVTNTDRNILQDISIIKCSYVKDAKAYRKKTDTDNGRKGNYLIYNDAWFKKTIGTNEWATKWVFAHELAHFALGHHGARENTLSVLEKETEADLYASCAIAKLGARWRDVEEFVTRVRSVKSQNYPSSIVSYDKFRECQIGLEKCFVFAGKKECD